jgi:hypothetical protein
MIINVHDLEMICPVTGGVIAGGGGIVVSGSQITDAVLSNKRRSSAENIEESKMVLPITFQPALLIPVADLNAIFPQNLTHEGKFASISP